MLLTLVIWRFFLSEAQDSILSGVMLTTADNPTFPDSLKSALIHLKDISQIYVIVPNNYFMTVPLPAQYMRRVKYVRESKFPFSKLDFTVFKGEASWYYQQILKLYAGNVLGLNSYVVLDSDLVWLQDVHFIDRDNPSTFLYTPSSHYHPHYLDFASDLLNMSISRHNYISGVSHHMVFKKTVLQALFERVEIVHKAIENESLPFWRVLITRCSRRNFMYKAFSEFEIYLNFALRFFPETVKFRPLYYTNGPKPNFLYVGCQGIGVEYGNELCFRQTPLSLKKQIFVDYLMGFDFVAYHWYARRRYSELRSSDITARCAHVLQLPLNSTCQWRSDMSKLQVLWDGGGCNSSESFYANRVEALSRSFDGCMCKIIKEGTPQRLIQSNKSLNLLLTQSKAISVKTP